MDKKEFEETKEKFKREIHETREDIEILKNWLDECESIILKSGSIEDLYGIDDIPEPKFHHIELFG